MRKPVFLALLALLIAAAPAAAKTKLVELRVEGNGTTLDKGTWYAVTAQKIKRGDGPDCINRRGADTFTGVNALTSLGAGQAANPALGTVRSRATDIGTQVCQIGSLKSFGEYPNASAGFFYFVNFESGFSAANEARVQGGDRVLWHYVSFPSVPPATGDPPSANTGCVLELSQVPAQDDDGKITVRVDANGFDCNPTDTGVGFFGSTSTTPLGGGQYEVQLAPGTTEITAVRSPDVRSNRFSVCVGPAANCPVAHGRKIVGSDRRDGIPGTAGFDRIRSGRGNDRINLRAGGEDRVSCGSGKDVVLAKRGDRDDRISRSCEKVRRR